MGAVLQGHGWENIFTSLFSYFSQSCAAGAKEGRAAHLYVVWCRYCCQRLRCFVRLTQQIDEFVKTACAIDDSQKQDSQIASQVSGRPPVSAAVLPQTCCAGHNSTCVCGSASNPHTQQHPRTKPSRSLTLTRWCYFPRLFFLVCSIAGRAV